jgi:hypothetical protein
MHMANQVLQLKSFGEFEMPKVGVRVERMSDKKYLGGDGKFSADRKAAKLFALTADVNEPTLVKYDIELVPAVFTNGRYNVYYYDISNPARERLFEIEDFEVIDGTFQPQRVPTTTDIAVRLMDSRVGKGTYRDVLAKIDTIYEWVKKQGG